MEIFKRTPENAFHGIDNFNFNIDLFRESVDPNNKDYIRPSTNKKRLDQFTKYQETGEAPKKTNEQAGIKHTTG